MLLSASIIDCIFQTCVCVCVCVSITTYRIAYKLETEKVICCYMFECYYVFKSRKENNLIRGLRNTHAYFELYVL